MGETPPTISQMFDLRQRVALVTGAAMGIGREIAQGLLEVGATVVLTSRKAERAEQAAEQPADDGCRHCGAGRTQCMDPI